MLPSILVTNTMPYIQDLFLQEKYSSAKDIACLLRTAKTIGIVAHASPDADALGSTLALAHGLQQLGKTVHICNASPIPDYLNWLSFTGPLYQEIPAEAVQPDVFVILDCGDAARLGQIQDMVLRYPTINIDHHLDNPHFASEYNWSDPNMAATGQMVASVLYALDVPLRDAVAENLYMAVSADTGNLTYGNTTEDVFLLCAHLMHNNLNLIAIRENVDNTWHLERMHLWGEIMRNLQLERNNTVALALVSLDLLAKHNATKEDLEGLAEHLRRLDGVLVAGFIREDETLSCKSSLRSTGAIDVREMLTPLGGGGHRNAAGATLHFDLQSSREKVFSSIINWLDAHKL